MLKKLLKLAVILGVTVYLGSGLNWQALIQSLQGYAPAQILLGVILAFLPLGIVGWRLAALVPFPRMMMICYEAVSVSHLADLILPAKTSEIVKVAYLKWSPRRVSFKFGIAAALLERVWDGLLLITMTIISLAAMGRLASLWVGIWVGGVLLGLTLALKWLPKALQNRRSKKWHTIQAFLKGKLPAWITTRMIQPMMEGIKEVWTPARIYKGGIISALGWGSMLLIFYVFLRNGSHFPLNWIEVVVVFTCAIAGLAVPAAPGGIGTFHAGMVMGLGLFGIPKTEALVSATLMHAILQTPNIVSGVAVLLIKDISLKSLKINRLTDMAAV